MEWAELHSLHLGSSRGFRGRSIPKQPTRASKRESQLKISARLGVWRKWQVKEALSCPCIPHRTHLPPTLPTRGQEQQLWGYSRAINYSEKKINSD